MHGGLHWRLHAAGTALSCNAARLRYRLPLCDSLAGVSASTRCEACPRWPRRRVFGRKFAASFEGITTAQAATSPSSMATWRVTLFAPSNQSAPYNPAQRTIFDCPPLPAAEATAHSRCISSEPSQRDLQHCTAATVALIIEFGKLDAPYHQHLVMRVLCTVGRPCM
jgi:hypothetical protein